MRPVCLPQCNPLTGVSLLPSAMLQEVSPGSLLDGTEKNTVVSTLDPCLNVNCKMELTTIEKKRHRRRRKERKRRRRRALRMKKRNVRRVEKIKKKKFKRLAWCLDPGCVFQEVQGLYQQIDVMLLVVLCTRSAVIHILVCSSLGLFIITFFIFYAGSYANVLLNSFLIFCIALAAS